MVYITIYINVLYRETSSNTTYTKGVLWEARQGSGDLFRYLEYGNQIPEVLNINTDI